MKKNLFKFSLLLISVIFLYITACEKDNEVNMVGEKVEFYLLKSYETQSGTGQILEETLILENEPLLTYNHLLSYDSKNYSFKISNDALAVFNQDGGLKCHFKAFALTVDKEIIYTGYFWPSYSSTILQWFTIDPLLISLSNEMRVELAYPSVDFAGTYPDNRNDDRIIEVFKRDGKLKY